MAEQDPIAAMKARWSYIQPYLFPFLRQEIDPLTAKLEQLVYALDMIGLEAYVRAETGGPGRPRDDRRAIARAFVAKAVLGLPSMTALRERLLVDGQPGQSLDQMRAELPTQCDVGTKKNSKGYKESWTGYKAHIDVACGQVPVSLLLTSASLHDSQAAIPLMTMTSERIDYLYDDRLYDFRTMVERVNARLKDEFGARFVRVRGAAKVKCHLMFGIHALTADQLMRLFSPHPAPT